MDRQLIRINFPWVANFVDGALSCVTYAGNTFVIEPVVWTAENAKQVGGETQDQLKRLMWRKY